MRDPVTPSVVALAARHDPPTGDSRWLDAAVATFKELSPSDQERTLRHLAIGIYRARGKYALTPLQLLIFQASAVAPSVALACSALLMLPLVVLAMCGGGMVARALTERDRLRDVA